jgi:Na+/H+ antiporter NhaD/arsenite permease-like protein
MATERATALFLVITAALLSTLLTNDVALFVVMPLTLGICRMTKMPATRLIVFEALTVNAGSALTPVGNPQNIFLWQQSNVSFGAFVLHMLPLVAILMALLLIVTACAFGNRRLKRREDQQQDPIDRQLLGVSLTLYLPFLLATNWHVAGWAVGVLLLIFILLRPRVLALVDWGLRLVMLPQPALPLHRV